MELDAPGVRSQPERLRTGFTARELDGSRRQTVRVVVPLERDKALRQPCKDGIVRGGLGQLDRKPTDLSLAGRDDRRVRGLGEQLRTQADSEDRCVQVEQPVQEEVLLAQPGMMLV